VSTTLDVRTIARLDRHEPWRGQCFHAGLLWEGHVGAPGRHRLDVHRPGDAAVAASATLVHTAEFVHPFGPAAVIVVGKHADPRSGWRTYHTVASCRAGKLRTRTRRMPAWLQVEQFGGAPGAMYFNEPGSRQVYRWNGLWPRALGPEIHLPGTMIPADDALYVLERNSVFPGQENLVRIDLATRSAERTFPTPRRRLCALVDLPATPWIAAAETWAEQVLLVERATNRLARVIPAPGGPVALARLGRCLVVLLDEPRRLVFLDLAGLTAGMGPAAAVAEWDLAAVGAPLGHVRALDVDPQRGDVYVRSPFHPRVADNEPAVTMVGDPTGETAARCGLPRPAPAAA
jgi:hypothetical protein